MGLRDSRLLVAFTLLGAGRVARAESAATSCYTSPRVIPGPGERLPANAPAIIFVPPTTAFVRDAAADFALELRGPDGAPVAFTVEQDGPRMLVAPGRPLAVGTHVLSYRDYCHILGAGRAESRFEVVAAVPLPAAAGEVRVDGADAGGPTCLPYQAIALVDLAPTSELLAFGPMARARVVFAGTTTEIGYGETQWSGGHLRAGAPFTCTRASSVVSGHLELAVHVAGSKDDPAPAALDATVRCPYAPEKLPDCAADASAAPDASSTDATEDTDRGGHLDAGVGGFQADARPPAAPLPNAHRAGGCAVGGAGAAPAGAVAALLMAGWLSRRRRACQRRTSM